MMIMKNQLKLLTLVLVLIITISSFATISQAASQLKISDEKEISDTQTQIITKSTADKKTTQPLSTLEIRSPSYVIAGEIFHIFVYKTSDGAAEIKPEPLEKAIVRVSWNNETYVTNMHGRVILSAPLVEYDKYFFITASKSGYNTDKVNVLVKNAPLQLVITAPSSIYEGESFMVIVTADNQSVADASVLFNRQISKTDSSGSVTFTAPEVYLNTIFLIQAYKSGYLNASTDIMVINLPTTPIITFVMDDIADTLTVTSVDSLNVLWSDIYIDGNCNISGLGTYVLAGDVIFSCQGKITLYYIPTCTILGSFLFTQDITPLITFLMNDIADTLTVTSVDSLNVLWSDIMINGSCDTSGLGIYVTAGDVIFNCKGRIVIIYRPTNKMLGLFDFTDNKLEIIAPFSIYEHQVFEVMIKVDGKPIEKACVAFNGIVQYTDYLGIVKFVAPEVNQSTTFEIKAFKEGYESATAKLLVLALKTFGSILI